MAQVGAFAFCDDMGAMESPRAASTEVTFWTRKEAVWLAV